MPREYLMFTLAGPLSAWGEIAVGERRSSWPRPSKSAVLGLVAASLGFDRRDPTAHAALNDGLHFAVRIDSPLRGFSSAARADSSLMPLRDYHTAQVPSARRGKKWATRAEELSEDHLNTILSERWYWIDMRATVALWPSGARPAPALAEIEAALREPVFALYLGRKSCPLGRPLNPGRVSAAGIEDAFQAYGNKDAADAAKALHGKDRLLCAMAFQALAAEPGREIWADANAVPQEQQTETQSRRDAIRDRRSWTFSDRAEARIRTSTKSGGGDVSIPG